MWLPKRVIFLVVLLVIARAEFARAQVFVVKNSFVEANVSADGEGFVTILQANGLDHLMFTNHSYLTVRVNNITYTNNPNSPTLDGSTGTGSLATLLTSGVTEIHHGGNSNEDTIRTTWEPAGPNGFRLIQDVYPVEFQWCGQVVIRISVHNPTSISIPAEAQYLLDLLTTDTLTSHSTDAPEITTRYGLGGTAWQDLTNKAPYFITMEYPFWQFNAPGIVAAGFTTDDLAPAPMGLIQPSDIAIVDWPTIAQTYAWSYPARDIGTPIDADNALLFVWPLADIAPGNTETIASTSYGTAPNLCYGNQLDALILQPEHIAWNGFRYIPNRFPVEAIVWNTSGIAVHTVTADQAITNSLSGLPGPINILAPGTSQYVSHSPGYVDSTIPSYGAATATWEDTVQTGYLTNCHSDSGYNISIAVTIKRDTATFVGGPCQNPILIDCQTKPDTGSGFPRIGVLRRTGSYDSSLCNARVIEAQASDTRMCTSCFVTSVNAAELQNMTFAVVDSANWKFRVSVVDSMQNGSATIVALDGTGQSDTAVYTYCTIPDTRAPWLWTSTDDSCAACERISIYDNRAWDRGLDTVLIDTIIGLRIDATVPGLNPNFEVRGLPLAMISTVPLSNSNFREICITAVDLAGNRIDSCFIFGSANIQTPRLLRFSLTVTPNPAADYSIISLAGPSANVQVFDILGREVASFRVTGNYVWNMAGLPAGTYIVRAEANGQVLSKRILKQ